MTNKEAIERIQSIKSKVSLYDDVVALRMAEEALENQKTGYWIDYGTKYDVRCSICNTQYPLKPISGSRLMGWKSDYCPGCGAKMGDKENES